MANLYFTDTAMSDAATSVSLTGDEARHAVQVARVRVGDSFDVSDGRGWRAIATVTAADHSTLLYADSRYARPAAAITWDHVAFAGDRPREA